MIYIVQIVVLIFLDISTTLRPPETNPASTVPYKLNHIIDTVLNGG